MQPASSSAVISECHGKDWIFLSSCKEPANVTIGSATICVGVSVMQKQGYYSYQFVLVGSDGTSRVVPSEGSYYQTENKYQALIYYRGRGERTDRLVGYGDTQFK